MSKNSLSKTLALTSINLGLGVLSGIGYAAITEKTTSGGIMNFDGLDYISYSGIGAILGGINGLKYTFISGISNEFAGDYANEAKIGGTLAINTIAGIICGYNSGSLKTGLQCGFAIGGALTLLDAMSFGVESYIDSQEGIEFDNLQVV